MEEKEELYNFGGIFDITQDDFKEDEQEAKFNDDFYVPSTKDEKCKNGEYVARIRFLPNVFSGRERKDRIIVPNYYAVDPSNPDRRKYYRTVTRNRGNDIASNAFFMYQFRDSKTYVPDAPVEVKEACKQFRKNIHYYSLVQIITDKQHPELEGKILIFRYGKQINQMLEQLIKGDPAIGRKSVIPFDPFNGKDFILKISKGTNDEKKDVNSYLHSSFDDGIIPISLDGGATRVQNTPEDKKKIYEWLVANSPKMDQVEINTSEEENEKQLIEAVRFAIGDRYYFNQVYKATYHKDYVESVETETVTDREQYAKPQPTIQPSAPQPNVASSASSQTSKFRSLKAAAEKSDVQPSAPQPSIQPQAEQPKVAQAAPANPNPSLSEMGEQNEIDEMMSHDLSDIDDIQ